MTTDGHPAISNANFEIDDETLEKLREGSQQTPIHRLLDLRPLALDAERVVFEMPIAEGALSQTGNLHGGAIATLIDVTAGTAAALSSPTFVPGENMIVTADMHIRYLGRGRGAWVRAEARTLRAGRQLVVVECTVHDEEGRLVASADFSSMVVEARPPVRQGDATQPDL